MPRDRRVHYLRSLCRILRETVREGDLVSMTQEEESPFAVLLVTATKEQAEEARNRLVAAVSDVGLPPGVRFGVGSFAHTMSDAREIIEEARGDLR